MFSLLIYNLADYSSQGAQVCDADPAVQREDRHQARHQVNQGRNHIAARTLYSG